MAGRIIYGAEPVDGPTAERLGMVQWSVPRAELQARARAEVDKLAAMSPAALQAAKQCVHAFGVAGVDGYAVERQVGKGIFASAETQALLKGFLDRSQKKTRCCLPFGTCGPAGRQVTAAVFPPYQQEYFMSTVTDVDWKSATSLAGKVVVMTGVSSGIGRATALQFVSAGAAVVGGDLNVKDGEALVAEIRASGGKADFLPLDLSDGASVDAFVAAAREFDPDIVVNVAGWDKIGPFMDNTPDLWDKLVRINFLGPIRMIHGLLPGLMAKRYGKVITVSSDAGRVGSLGETFYAGTKGGIIAFTKSLAREMSRYNINCNVICPGPTDTPLFHSIESEKLRAALVSASPMRRLGKPVEVANGIVFLASPAADFVQGQVLSVSGGLTMHG